MVNEKAALFQFKMAMATSSLGMSSVVRGDDKKIELWVHGRNELYSLEAIKGNCNCINSRVKLLEINHITPFRSTS